MHTKNDFLERVARQKDRLGKKKLRAIEAEVAGKRIAWHKNKRTDGRQPLTPRKAYELLIIDYLGLPEDQVRVVTESEKEITWLSVNPCPTLDACKELGLDTRKVCRAAYEKSTQSFLSQIDPELRFWRDYDEIRPHARHCKEKILRIDFEEMMRVAIEEARTSLSEGNKGYGAVIVLGGEILAKAHDTAVTEKDPSLHGEVNAIRQAVRALGEVNLCGAVLFSTCEPCPMCTSLAVWANVTSIVYGVSIEETASLGRSRIMVSCEEIVKKSPATIEVIGPVLNDECKALYV